MLAPKSCPREWQTARSGDRLATTHRGPHQSRVSRDGRRARWDETRDTTHSECRLSRDPIRGGVTVTEDTGERVSTTVPLNWNEVWFTNCPMVSANNVDQELGWCREEYKKIGVEYAYFRHAPENNW
jgi:hypothetical protein